MTTVTPPPTAPNAELVRWAFDVVNTHDVSPLRRFWTSDSVERFPDRACRGADEIASYFEDTFAAIRDFHMEVIAIAEQGDNVVVRWRMTGVHSGELLGIAPTNKPLEIEGMSHFVIREGIVESNFVVFDQMQYARQIGMMPAQDSSADKAVKGLFNARTRVISAVGRSS